MPIAVDFDTATKLVSPILVAIIGGVVKRIVEGKPRLIVYLVHASEHPLPAPAVPQAAPQLEGPIHQEQVPAPPVQAVPRAAHSHAIVVRNSGKKSAHNVRISHGVLPVSYRVWPPLNYVVNISQDGSGEILIPVLVPNEQLTVSYLYFPPLTWQAVNAWVKSDEGMAKAIQTIPTSPPPRVTIWLLWFLVFVGASTIVYWLLKLLPLVLQ
jgi:hypothetical protein